MRFEQIIAAVTRNMASAIVREIEAVGSFVNALRLHLWLQQTSLRDGIPFTGNLCPEAMGMPVYPGNPAELSHASDVGGCTTRFTSSKRGSYRRQPMLILASCPARDARDFGCSPRG